MRQFSISVTFRSKTHDVHFTETNVETTIMKCMEDSIQKICALLILLKLGLDLIKLIYVTYPV